MVMTDWVKSDSARLADCKFADRISALGALMLVMIIPGPLSRSAISPLMVKGVEAVVTVVRTRP